MLPPIEDLYLASLEEIQTAIRLSLKSGWQLVIEPLPIGVWSAILYDETDVNRWEDEQVDQRILLFNLYGWLRREAGVQPSHPVWCRRGEVQIPSHFGRKAHQGTVIIPDPGDIDPDEVALVYGLPTSEQKEPR